MKLIKTVLRAFILGVGVGILIAPRSGQETRQMLTEKFDNLMDNIGGGEAGGQRIPSSEGASSAVVPNQDYAGETTSSVSGDLERSGPTTI